MTTIVLSERVNCHAGTYQVFGVHSGREPSDNFVFHIQVFPANPRGKAMAEIAAKRMMRLHEADHFERRK